MTTELVPTQITPSELFVPNGLNAILAGVQKKVAEFNEATLDIEDKKDRDKIRSFAHNVAKSKTFIDDKRAEFVKERKEALKVVAAEGNRFCASMDEIKKSVRKPLTDWEDAEKVRLEAEEAINQFNLEHEEALQMHDLFLREEAIKIQQAEMDAKQKELDRIALEQKTEKERIEREAIIKQEAKEQAERDAETARIEAETKLKEAERKRLADIQAVKDKAKKEAEEAEAKRLADIKAEKDRLEEEKAKHIREAGEKRIKAGKARSEILSEIGITLDTETCAGMDESVWIEFHNDKNKIYQDEQNRIALAEMRRIADDKLKREQAAKDLNEAKRIADEKAETDRLQKIEDDRQADTNHRKKINQNIVKCLKKFKIDESVSEKIVTSIVRGEIPGLSVNY